ncbi:MAG TPA: hypothetical protein VFO28_08330 [Burkholderiaceae bacterium]|nr:hypothetical protein [Burkholderiaceae bacterium]
MLQTFNVGSRSLFVSVTAWVFILLGFAASVLAVIQGASIASLLPGFNLQLDARPLQGLTKLLAGHLPWVAAVALALSIGTLVAAAGLLLRLEWARRAFIAVVGLAIVANLAGLWLQQELLQALIDHTLSRAALPREAAGVFGGFATVARAAAVALSVGTCLALAWIIARLSTQTVRQEFA